MARHHQTMPERQEALADAALAALPYIESEIGNPAYKAGAVARVAKRLRDALEAAGAC
jgi:hypothetical protein